MLSIPDNLKAAFSEAMERESVPSQARMHYLKWLRYYLDFCDKYHHLPLDADSRGLFLRKLSQKGQNAFLQKQASDAIGLYLGRSPLLWLRTAADESVLAYLIVRIRSATAELQDISPLLRHLRAASSTRS